MNKLWLKMIDRKLVIPLLISSLTAIGCTTTKFPHVVDAASAGKCEEAAEQLAKADKEISPFESAMLIGGKTTSYSVATVGYASETILLFAAGLVTVGVFCGPEIALSAATKSSIPCIRSLGPEDDMFSLDPTKKQKQFGLGVGDAILHETKPLRVDPNVEALSVSVRSISKCYQKRGDLKNLEKAHAQLSEIKQEGFSVQVPESERVKILEQYMNVEDDIKRLDPDYFSRKAKNERDTNIAMLANHAPGIWRDLDTGKFWRFQKIPVFDADAAEKYCEAAKGKTIYNWTLPNVQQFKAAMVSKINQSTQFQDFRFNDSIAIVTGSEGEPVFLDLKTGEEILLTDELKPKAALLCVY
ncbi:MAG: hypothetical protein NT027_04840 [Proteobacteria bacterium]|nr:hypothetical protein [Pseudomonadota bacterium]